MKQDHYVSALTAFRGFGGTSRLQFLNLHVQPFFFSIPPSSVRYRHIKQTKKSTHKGSDVTAQHAHGIHSLSLIFFFLWFTRIFFDHEMRTKKNHGSFDLEEWERGEVAQRRKYLRWGRESVIGGKAQVGEKKKTDIRLHEWWETGIVTVDIAVGCGDGNRLGNGMRGDAVRAAIK